MIRAPDNTGQSWGDFLSGTFRQVATVAADDWMARQFPERIVERQVGETIRDQAIDEKRQTDGARDNRQDRTMLLIVGGVAAAALLFAVTRK